MEVIGLEPVTLAGTVVRRATLNNEDFIRDLDLRIGDNVFVEKGGEIIPKITGSDPDSRLPGAEVPAFPTRCPDCGTPLVKPEGEARWFCPNQDGCPQQIKGRLVHFVGRKAMNILAGEATVEQLYSLNLVRTPADLYDLRKGQLVLLEGWKDRAAERFLESLAESRSVGFDHVLFALGIRYVGETTARELARHFGDIDSLAAASREELLAVEDVGDVIADSILAWFAEPRHLEEVARLKAAGLQFSLEGPSQHDSEALAGKTVVISGNFSISREAMKALIERHGGRSSGSVSGKTSWLLAGEKAGPEKLKKAAQLGIPVIGEAEFRALLPDTGVAAPQSPAPKRPEELEPTLF